MVYTVQEVAGKKTACPRCQSTQIKALSVQPRKYPKPEPDHNQPVHSESYLRAIYTWQKSFSCQRCGEMFLVLRPGEKADAIERMVQASVGPAAAPAALASPVVPKRPSVIGRLFKGLFKLIMFLVLLVVAYVVYRLIPGAPEKHYEHPQIHAPSTEPASSSPKPVSRQTYESEHLNITETTHQ